MFHDGPIEGVIIRALVRHADQRGWLSEVFRDDEILAAHRPAMAYVSETKPGVARGPHEHVNQTDMFGFLGPSTFKLYLWDRRPDSPTVGARTTTLVGVDNPAVVIIPPGVVHAYKNVGADPGWVINLPNRLFRGVGRKEPVDEIRHEDDADSPYALD